MPLFAPPAARSSPRFAAATRTYSRSSSAPRAAEGDDALDERVLGGEHEEGGSEERVGPRREDRDRLPQLLELEQHLGALGPSDPVALGRDHPLGPSERREVEQLIGVAGRLEEPLRDVARLDQCAAALAASVPDLLVRKHRLVVRAPLDRRRSALGEPGCVQLQEQPLRPAVVLRLVGGELARPVDRPADRLHRPPDRVDVPFDDLARVAAVVDRGVLGRQAERVEPHRPQHLEAVAAVEMRPDVAERVDEHVAHVQRARRIRQHLEHVALERVPRRARLRVLDLERTFCVPDLLPLALDCVRVVRVQIRA